MSFLTILGVVVIAMIVLISIAAARVASAGDQRTEQQIGRDPMDVYRRYRAAEERALLESLAWRKRRERLAERLERERVA
jgi:hypothetical protein